MDQLDAPIAFCRRVTVFFRPVPLSGTGGGVYNWPTVQIPNICRSIIFDITLECGLGRAGWFSNLAPLHAAMDGAVLAMSMPNLLAVEKACETLSCKREGLVYASCINGFNPWYLPALLDEDAIFRSIQVHFFQGVDWSPVTRSLRNFRSLAYALEMSEGLLRPPSARGASKVP